MGTVLQTIVVADDPEVARRLAARSIEIAERWDDVLTIWRPDGELARLNAQAGMGDIAVSEELAAALDTMLRIARDTGGAFNPAVGGLVARYASGARMEWAPPPARLDEVLRIRGSTARLESGVVLDSGGIGKGIALDAISRELRVAGVRGAYVDFGGSSQLAFGRNEQGAPWRVALAGLTPGEILGTIDLDGALSTSRSRAAGDAAGPIVDPSSGAAVEEPRLATCLADSAAVADGWSTALVVTGASALRSLEALGVSALVVSVAGLHVTPEFDRQMRQSRDAAR